MCLSLVSVKIPRGVCVRRVSGAASREYSGNSYRIPGTRGSHRRRSHPGAPAFQGPTSTAARGADSHCPRVPRKGRTVVKPAEETGRARTTSRKYSRACRADFAMNVYEIGSVCVQYKQGCEGASVM
ncbi:hypothetical protein NDU88_000215 [Pleurodeles waltl]|uniref:Uncharacterized protein n=1 Tax=Pleurodeles waltl TaxID=8319 RepID=A0AAV7KV11_PLEWA|nr:hypothetical protein NDU88_000215 [Pleurodeles waltl]